MSAAAWSFDYLFIYYFFSFKSTVLSLCFLLFFFNWEKIERWGSLIYDDAAGTKWRERRRGEKRGHEDGEDEDEGKEEEAQVGLEGKVIF